VAAPFAGVVTLEVAEGDSVEAGQTVASIEAMKMQAAITPPWPGPCPRAADTPQRTAGSRAVGLEPLASTRHPNR
jgi:pyruvate carboxylase